MAQKIIIDGYNVIYADERLRKIACRDMRRARNEFLKMVTSYITGKRIQATVVFDGRGALADADAVIPGKLQVVYSPEGQTADDLIISTLKRSGNPQAYLVVSSDRSHIVPVGHGLGCQVLGSSRFLERMSPGEVTAAAQDDEKPDPIEEDTQYWLDEFGKADG